MLPSVTRNLLLIQWALSIPIKAKCALRPVPRQMCNACKNTQILMSGTADVHRVARSWVASEGLLLAAPGRESHGRGVGRWALLSPLMEPAVIAPAHSSCGCGGAVLVLSAPQLNVLGCFFFFPICLLIYS